MKISITLKDPDTFSEAVDQAVRDSLEEIYLTDKEKEVVRETREEDVWEFLDKWVQYQEYVTIEFDTVAKTATVKESR